MEDLEICGRILLRVLTRLTPRDESDLNGELLDVVLLSTHINLPSKFRGPNDTVDGYLDFFGCIFHIGHHDLVPSLPYPILRRCWYPRTPWVSSSSIIFAPSRVPSPHTHHTVLVPIKRSYTSSCDMFPHRMALFARGLLRQDGRLSPLGLGPFLTPCTKAVSSPPR